MIKRILPLFLMTLSLLQSADLLVLGTGKMVKTAAVESTNRVYLGSFLASGWLPAADTYRIDAPVEGVIEKLTTRLYEPVVKGQLLAVIKSPRLLELESTYIDTLIEKEYYANEVKRLKPLYEAAVVARKRYLEAQNTLAKYRTRSHFYYQLLMEWGLSERQVERITKLKKPIPEIRIYAPITGKVADLNVYPKMYAERGTHMMTVIDAERAHYEVALPLKLAKLLEPDSGLFVDDTPVKVESIAATVDARTQTVAVHLLPEKGIAVLPGEKRNIKLYWPRKALALPASAVIDFDERPALFVKTGEGYRLVFITILGRSADTVYAIGKGLEPGSAIAVTGVISLKGALEAQSND